MAVDPETSTSGPQSSKDEQETQPIVEKGGEDGSDDVFDEEDDEGELDYDEDEAYDDYDDDPGWEEEISELTPHLRRAWS